MVAILAGGGAAAGSVGAAGNSTGTANFPGMGNDSGTWENNGSWEEDSASSFQSLPTEGSFTYQGRAYDPILYEPMEVSAEMHGDYWEDDMDYSESVIYDATQSKAGTQAKTNEKSCENCPPEGKVAPMVRRCSRWSEITISYQTRICGTFYNPETKQIQEFKYCGVSFDGWKPKLCQFWEAKARYDQFLISSHQKKTWWRGDRSAINQASRHQAVATVNQPLKIIWIFMQPISFAYFSNMFIGMKDIIVRYQP